MVVNSRAVNAGMPVGLPLLLHLVLLAGSQIRFDLSAFFLLEFRFACFQPCSEAIKGLSGDKRLNATSDHRGPSG
jgi:hypothetical protein